MLALEVRRRRPPPCAPSLWGRTTLVALVLVVGMCAHSINDIIAGRRRETVIIAFFSRIGGSQLRARFYGCPKAVGKGERRLKQSQRAVRESTSRRKPRGERGARILSSFDGPTTLYLNVRLFIPIISIDPDASHSHHQLHLHHHHHGSADFPSLCPPNGCTIPVLVAVPLRSSAKDLQLLPHRKHPGTQSQQSQQLPCPARSWLSTSQPHQSGGQGNENVQTLPTSGRFEERELFPVQVKAHSNHIHTGPTGASGRGVRQMSVRGGSGEGRTGPTTLTLLQPG